MEKDLTLVVLAAGMGSRYGGLKQLDPFTAHGEFLTDFSSYDAFCAGFKRVVFVIKPENEEIFRKTIGARIEKKMEVKYAHQTSDRFVPGDFQYKREKPWGTGHALLCCEGLFEGNFMMINCDDLYGAQSYKVAAEYLKKVEPESGDFAMCGFLLRNTLSDIGSVSRGICEIKNGYLSSIVERTNIYEVRQSQNDAEIGKITADDGMEPKYLSPDSIVSMNAFCFTQKIFPILKEYFGDFVKNLGEEEVPKKEFYIPSALDRAMKVGRANCKVLESNEKWFGVTYASDKEIVKAHLSSLCEKGIYPSPLFK